MKKFGRFSKISRKITFSMILLILLASFLIGSIVSMYSGKLLESNSYTQFKTIEQQALKNINDSLSVVMHQFMSLEIDDDFIAIAQNKTEDVKAAQFSTLKRLFRIYRSNNTSLISNVLFYRYDGTLFSDYSYITSGINSDLFAEKAKNDLMRPVWMFPGIKVNGVKLEKSEEYISLVKEVNDGNKRYGVLIFNLDKRTLQDIFDTIDIQKDSFRMYLKDNDGNVILEVGEYIADTSDFEINTNEDVSKILSDGSMFIKNSVELGDFELVFCVSGEMMARQKILVMNFFVYCIALSLLVVFAVAYLVSGIITKPLVSFTKAIKNTEEGNYNISFEYAHDDEIGSLVNTYKKMMEKTQNLIERIKNEQELKSIAELNSLRQQIDAHFLYNALDIIYWFSKNGEGNKAAEVTIALSKMLRVSVSNGRDVITVKEEVMHLESYLTVQNYRFDFEYTVDISPEMSEYNIPKLILQPLAENAIVHGFEDIDYPAKLEIKGFIKDDRLVFKIKDNGVGFIIEDALKNIDAKDFSLQKSSKYALKNMKMRFNIIFGEGDYIKFISEPGKGTCVIITLPML